MTTQAAGVSVILPISQAIDRVKLVLFHPFDPGRWFAIGFCAWLAFLGEQGARGNFNYGVHNDRDFHHEFDHARHFVLENMFWIAPLVIAVVVAGIAVWLLFLWLSSRGKFMFLNCVALNKDEIVAPWHRFAREGNSLFWFRLVLGLVALVPMLALGIGFAAVVIRVVGGNGSWLAALPLLLGLGLAFFVLAIALALITKLTTDFVVPIMFLRGKGCLEGWRELLRLLSTNLGHFVLYILFQIVLAIVIGTMVFVAVLATCCIAGCLLALPYLGTVFFLPVLVFKRAYSIHYLAQYGPDFDVLRPPAAPPPSIGTTPSFV